MSDKFHGQLRGPLPIPRFLERENTEQQIIVPGHLIRATGARGPDLRGDELNEFWIPRNKLRTMFADVAFHDVSELQVEIAKIHADDCVRLVLDGEPLQLEMQAPEL